MNLFNSLGNFNDLLKLARDEHFQKFMMHPKVQSLMKDKEFEQAVKEKNFIKLMNHAEFANVLKDPEVASALEQMRKKFDQSS